MISEKWDLKIDIDQLKEHLKKNVLDKEMISQSKSFGGWSVLSSNGSHKDGWQMGHVLLDPNSSIEDKARIQSQMTKKFSEYTLETEICTGYLEQVIQIVREKKLNPYRARIICLKANMASSWHRDSEEKHYAVRLHVPIVTNSGCFFETRTEREHLPADGSAYFIYVNREHRVVNHGTEDRFHLVMDVRDTEDISQFHRYKDFVMKQSI